MGVANKPGNLFANRCAVERNGKALFQPFEQIEFLSENSSQESACHSSISSGVSIRRESDSSTDSSKKEAC